MSNEKRKPNLDLQVCYSGFKVEELEYIGFSRTDEDREDAFLDTFNGKLDDGTTTDDEDEEIMAHGEYESASFYTEGYRSYLCSTPTPGRKHRGSFPQDADISGFTERDYCARKSFPTNFDSGVQTQLFSTVNSMESVYGDENVTDGESLESLPRSNRVLREIAQPNAVRKRIELNTNVQDPYSNVDDLDISIEEEISQQISQENASTTTIGTLRRRLSLKLVRKNKSTGLFGSYLQRIPALPAPTPNNQQVITNDQAPLLHNKPTGPVNLWFRKFRNRHFI